MACDLDIISLSLSINIASISVNGVDLSSVPSVGRSECVFVGLLCVCKVYCGKTAELIRMPFGMVSGISRLMGVLDASGECRRGRGSFWGEFGASHCNQWGLCCVVL